MTIFDEQLQIFKIRETLVTRALRDYMKLDKTNVTITIGNSTLLDWINDEIESLGEENFFHADYEATLLDTYGADYEDTLVIEGGATK